VAASTLRPDAAGLLIRNNRSAFLLTHNRRIGDTREGGLTIRLPRLDHAENNKIELWEPPQVRSRNSIRYGLASNTKLNGVWVARRKRVKPPLTTTSRNPASPACAPSAGPLEASEAGTQIIVEAA
jgi:hypothetical protein